MSERVARGVYFEGDDRILSYSSWFIGPWNGAMVEPRLRVPSPRTSIAASHKYGPVLVKFQMLIQPMFTPFSPAEKSLRFPC
jgi:hypothetical protein